MQKAAGPNALEDILRIRVDKVLPLVHQIFANLLRLLQRERSFDLFHRALPKLRRQATPDRLRETVELVREPVALLRRHTRGRDDVTACRLKRINEEEAEDFAVAGLGAVDEREGRHAVLVEVGKGDGASIPRRERVVVLDAGTVAVRR